MNGVILILVTFLSSFVRAEVIQVDEILVSSDVANEIGVSGGVRRGLLTILKNDDLEMKKSQTFADVVRELAGIDVARAVRGNRLRFSFGARNLSKRWC